jgi:hypothetical protein
LRPTSSGDDDEANAWRELSLALDFQPTGKSSREKQLSFAALRLIFALELSAYLAAAG